MRLKFGLLLRALLITLTFTVFVVLWSLLGTREEDLFGDKRFNPGPVESLDGDRFRPIIPWPSVEGLEVDLQQKKLEKMLVVAPIQVEDNVKKQRDAVERQYATFRPQKNHYPLPVLRPTVLGNFELKGKEPPGVPGGPGEGNRGVDVGPELKDAALASIKEYGFNMVASDLVSLDRSIGDIRHEQCKYWHYDENLPTASIIIVFHNEGWSTFVRTIHSVVKRTPSRYLAEIVLIDDFSTKEHLKERLEEYIKQWNGLVKLFRNSQRQGLIRARSTGAQKAELGQVLVYLDAHCEVGMNWYPPLVAPIAHNRMVSTVPLIDSINGNDYTLQIQGGGDEDGFARGAWDWSMLWKRVPLTKREHDRRKERTEPYRSPAMAGGLFAIEREFFFELGLYDPGLQIWGGENFEISFKIWQCGGEVLFVPCSRAGHIYRMKGWDGNPAPPHVGSSPTLKIRGLGTNYCIDSMGHKDGGILELGPCHRMGGNQLFRINEAQQMMQYDQCLMARQSDVAITHCKLREYQEWTYKKEDHVFVHTPTFSCLDRDELLHKVQLAPCVDGKKTQLWEMNNVGLL
uniref:N-acetylgalactosaminyltransferase 7-like isoform X2 n=1 Tax=Myxine glutinosa TaxID=7769 RepID=UPI00358F5F81